LIISIFKPMMDRAKKDELPKMQGSFSFVCILIGIKIISFSVGFIDSICLPLYKVN
jgi:hypothetical protein